MTQDSPIKCCPRCGADSHVRPGAQCTLKEILHRLDLGMAVTKDSLDPQQYPYEEMRDLRDTLEFRNGRQLRDHGVLVEPAVVPLKDMPVLQRVAMIEEWRRQILAIEQLILVTQISLPEMPGGIQVDLTQPVEVKHRSDTPFKAICGADEPNQHTVFESWEGVNCPQCLALRKDWCPFCGSRRFWRMAYFSGGVPHDSYHAYRCDLCGTTGPISSNEGRAVELSHHRADKPRTGGPLPEDTPREWRK